MDIHTHLIRNSIEKLLTTYLLPWTSKVNNQWNLHSERRLEVGQLDVFERSSY